MDILGQLHVYVAYGERKVYITAGNGHASQEAMPVDAPAR
jgi:UPF0288 family protein (methanogenesis marker protein 3)